MLAASLVAACGIGVAVLNVDADRKSGISPEAMLSFGAVFSWWLAGAASVFVYVLAGAYLLRVRAATENPRAAYRHR